MAFSLESLKASVKQFQDKKSDNNGEWPKATFLPEGNHKVRFITDPSDEVFCEYYSFGYFARGIRDPRDDTGVPEGFVNELQTIYENDLQPLNKWSYGSKYQMLAYVWLYETDSPNENWQPDNLYVIIANKKFAESYVSFLGTLAKDAPDEIMKSLNPTLPGVILTINFKGGRDGGCAIGATFPVRQAEPINMKDQGYAPLEVSYIRPGFNQEKYDALVKRYKEDVLKLKGMAAAIAPAEGTTPAAELPVSAGQAMINAGAGGATPVETAAATTVAAVVTPEPTLAEVAQQKLAETQADIKSLDAGVVNADAQRVADAPFENGTVVETQAAAVTPVESTTTPAAAVDAEDPWAKFRT